MTYKGVVLTDIVGAYGELRHAVKRGIKAVWYNVALLALVAVLIRSDAYTVRLFCHLCGIVLVLRWVIVFKAFLQFRAVREAMCRSHTITKKIRLGGFMALKINGAWFLFRKVASEQSSRWKFNMFERVFVEGSEQMKK